uniref:Uncharacterized protein n=1 Tax=Lepeophtheirus salmonis TaxID=72036 RepID=A0A0K2TI77_LEPSM
MDVFDISAHELSCVPTRLTNVLLSKANSCNVIRDSFHYRHG